MSNKKEKKDLIAKLKFDRNQICLQLNRFFDFISNCDKLTNRIKINERFVKCEALWDEFNKVQLELDYIEGSASMLSERTEFEEQYFETVYRFKELLQDHLQSNSSAGAANSAQSLVKLPPLDLPTFSGNYDSWLGFYDTFVALIHSNNNLSNVQKFYYLQSCLKGESARVIHSLEVNDRNYEVAFKLLRERYENTKFIIQSHVKCLFEIPIVGKNTLVDLRKFVDTIQSNLRALKSLKEPVDHWDTLLLHMFSSKLDIYSRREWETLCAKESKISFTDFIKFLNERCSVLENMEIHKLGSNQSQFSTGISGFKGKISQSHVMTGLDNHNCIYCKSGKHALYHCSQFLNLNEMQRISEIKKLHLCLNCFKSNHISTRCSYKGCLKCGKPYNTLLHIDYSKNTANRAVNIDNKIIGNSQSDKVSGNGQSDQTTSGSELNKTQNSQTHSHVCACTSVTNKKIRENSDSNISKEVENNQLLEPSESERKVSSINIYSNLNSISEGEVLLSTAVVFVMDQKGTQHEVRALLDCGSQSNFITSKLVTKLGLKLNEENISIVGINSTMSTSTKSVQTSVISKYNGFAVKLSFLVLNQITNDLPMLPVNKESLKIPSNIYLADPHFDIPGKIDILLGANIFYELLLVGQIKMNENMPVIQKTRLGWIISGSVPEKENKTSKRVQSSFFQTVCNLSLNTSIDQQIEKFWLVEEIQPTQLMRKEERECEELFLDTTKHETDGRFIVRLPVKEGIENLGESRQMAERRFIKLERKLQLHEEIKHEYDKFMAEYERLGHMTEIRKEEIETNKPVYYMPHHAVIKNDSTTTKLRVVFDASAKTVHGISLNDKLKNGPIIQDQLYSILARFRQHNYVLGADAEKMYRQIWIDPEQRDLQRIVWRREPSEELKHYRLNTVTYGTTSASFLAIRCLNKAAEEQEEIYPKAGYEIKKNFYVDDLLTGASTIEEARKLKYAIIEGLKKSGFTLRKWVSNNKAILNDVQENSKIEQYIVDQDVKKTLGLVWNCQEDSLTYMVQIESCLRPTKRNILSILSKIFDPLGLVGAIIIRAKIIMQQLWIQKTDWDQEVSPEIYEKWKQFYNDLPYLNNLQVPRHGLNRSPVAIEIQGYCDASERAYGACLYLRSIDEYGKIMVSLLCAKSKVAPIKTLTLPRLELCGALLLFRLIKKTLDALSVEIREVNCWTDSKIVLSWLAAEPAQWNVFVSHRIAEIQQNNKINNWNHVKSEDNLADLISRGCDTKQLIVSRLWWNGPDWLSKKTDHWPQDAVEVDDSELPEKRNKKQITMCIVDQNIFARFSSFLRVQRVVAYCIRFCKNSRLNKESRVICGLTADELDCSLICLVKRTQSADFSSEIQALQSNKPILRSSKLIALNPFLDKNGLLRVGGRLSKSKLSFDQKFPIILNNNHILSNLMISYEHRKNLHMGPQNLLANIRTRFWILGGISAIKKILRKCIICFKVKPRSFNTLMGELPEQRLMPAKPFFNCGVDYAGPFNIKSSKLRQSKVLKAYLCVFVCFVTRAVHLEVVSDLTTECFLNSLKRFIARRGKCKNMFSDCGTNFVGATNEMREFAKFLQSNEFKNEVSECLSQDGINWSFIPPRSPHFGGLWEAGVRMAKYHFHKIIRNASLTFEELTTVFAQIEACMNSRPLSPLSNDPNDLSPLTPGHFLVGEPLVALPESDMREVASSKLNRFHYMKQMVQHFWDRWYKECISDLNKRSKWKYPTGSGLKVGDMVILKEDNLPPLKWPLGRIEQLYPGSDGIVRVVLVKTTKGSFKRAVVKICVLPME